MDFGSIQFSFESVTEAVLIPEARKSRQKGARRKPLQIGLPKETMLEERRVALSPDGVAQLVEATHRVRVERGAGTLARFSDEEYARAGADIVDSAAEVYRNSEVVVKVEPPSLAEQELLRREQVLISAMHLGSMDRTLMQIALEKKVTAIGFELIESDSGELPIVRAMSEIAGSMVVPIAARLLECESGGRGIVLGGIPGVPPATVVIIGAGTLGEFATRTALGLGAHVIVLDRDLARLKRFYKIFERRVTTAMLNETHLRRSLAAADVVIAALYEHKGGKARPVVSEEQVQRMRDGSVIVDVVIDQGGCVETSRPTTHSSPTFTLHGVTHYCVPNIPSNVARTATHALTNVLTPILLEIGEEGSIHKALWHNPALRRGVYAYHGHPTHATVAALFGLEHRDIDLVLVTNGK